MFKKIALCIALSCMVCSLGCENQTMDAGCVVGETMCGNNVRYICTNDKNTNDGKNINNDYTFWIPLEICPSYCYEKVNNGERETECSCVPNTKKCENNDVQLCKPDANNNYHWEIEYSCEFDGCDKYGEAKCEMNPVCINNEKNGNCQKAQACIIDWNEDGSCIMQEGCVVGWEEDGSCIKMEGCKFGWNENGSCTKSESCRFGWNEDGTCVAIEGCVLGTSEEDGGCIPMPDCIEGHNFDGSCSLISGCIVGWNENGSCKKDENCKNDWNANGSCLCPGTCAYECNADGSCIKDVKCQNGWNDNGTCLKDGCNQGYNDDGTCICPDSCLYGCEENGDCAKMEGCETQSWNSKDGSCLCPEGCNQCDSFGVCCPIICKQGCGTDGICLCPIENDMPCSNGCDVGGNRCCNQICKLGCDSNGDCIKVEGCKYGWLDDGTCDHNKECQNGWEVDGSCTCPAMCEKGCYNNGRCIFPEGCDEDASCANREYCKDDLCYCSDNQCILKDTNNNHMDDRYEKSEKFGQPCTSDEECDSLPGRGDGLCDSFVGYTCSRKCTKIHNDEIIDDAHVCLNTNDEFDYICRSDGRCAPNSFVTVWNMAKNESLSFPNIQDESCEISINWGDDDFEVVYKYSDKIEHTYKTSKQYVVKLKVVKGTYHFSLCPAVDKISGDEQYQLEQSSCSSNAGELVEVRAFGPVALKMAAFATANNLTKISSVDIPNPAFFKNGFAMFYKASSFNDKLDNWDVSQLTCTASMFNGANKFNQSLNSWKVANVINMKNMFNGAKDFNQPLDLWTVSNVTNMQSLFESAESFNQSLNSWNVENVKNMANMFYKAASFNQPLNNWKVGNVTNMANMFYEAAKFNQPLNDWNVQNVINMRYMFYRAKDFKRALNSWNVSKVTDMERMFAHATSFNNKISDWNVSNVTNMIYMFAYAEAFNQDISKWNVSKGTKVDSMFWNSGISKENYCKIYKSCTWKYDRTNRMGIPLTKYNCGTTPTCGN